MNAFITGSRAYGKPKKGSDVDLVILVSSETERILRQLSGDSDEPIKFGGLNIIACTNESEFAMWKLATTKLMIQKQDTGTSIDKMSAKIFMDVLRSMINVKDRGDSSGGSSKGFTGFEWDDDEDEVKPKRKKRTKKVYEDDDDDDDDDE